MRPLISQGAARSIDTLRVRGWETAFLTSDPQLSLVLYRDDVDDPLPAQDVVMDVHNNQPNETAGGTGIAATSGIVTFRRPLSYGFDVEVGDTFKVQEMAGTITVVIERNGMIYADANIDVGTT